jgi:hypothetical protein
MQFQLDPLIPVAVKPTGSVSVTVTVPTLDAEPLFETVSVYEAPDWPWTKAPECVIVSLKSGEPAGATDVGSLAALLPVFDSPPPETEAVLVTLAGALLATLTVRVIGG